MSGEVVKSAKIVAVKECKRLVQRLLDGTGEHKRKELITLLVSLFSSHLYKGAQFIEISDGLKQIVLRDHKTNKGLYTFTWNIVVTEMLEIEGMSETDVKKYEEVFTLAGWYRETTHDLVRDIMHYVVYIPKGKLIIKLYAYRART